MSAPAPQGDPGWPFGPTLLRSLIPGYLHLFVRGRGVGRDGLLVLRAVWLSLTWSVVLLGIVVILVVPDAETSSSLPWHTLVPVAGVVALAAAGALGRLRLDCSDPARLAAGYRARFFLRLAVSEAVALFGFVAAFLANTWWLYWLGALFTLTVFVWAAPTQERLAADQQVLSAQGCPHDLVEALRRPVPPMGS